MNGPRWLAWCAGGALVLSSSLGRAQDARESDLKKELFDLTASPPKECGPLDKLYFEASAFADARDEAGKSVSAVFDTYLADLAQIRFKKKCPKTPPRRRSPTDRARLLGAQRRLLAESKTCKGDACKVVEEALKTNFFTIAAVLGRNDPAIPEVMGQLVVGVPADALAEDLIRRIRAGDVAVKDLLEIARATFTRASASAQAPSLLPEIAAFLKKMGDGPAISETALKDLFAAVFNLAANRRLSKDTLKGLLNQLRTVVSDDDLISLAGALSLRQSVRTQEDWETLRASLKLMVDIDSDLKAKVLQNRRATRPWSRS